MAVVARYRAADIPGAVDGQRVKVWPDISGNGRDLEAPEGAIFREGGFQGLPCLDFDARLANGYVSEWDGFGGVFTVYVVVQTRSTDSDIICGGVVGDSPFYLYDRNNTWRVFQTFAGSSTASDFNPSTRLPTVLSWSHDGADGVIATSDRAMRFDWGDFPDANPLPPAPLRVGIAADGGSRYMDGLIAEVVVYDEAHTGELREQTSRDLAEAYKFWATKWGSPHDIAGPFLPVSHIEMRRERFPAYQASGVGDGDGDREVTEGQVWPR